MKPAPDVMCVLRDDTGDIRGVWPGTAAELGGIWNPGWSVTQYVRADLAGRPS